MSERSDAAEVIEFRADDGVLARASKMFAALGFANDRFGMAARLAGYLATYQELWMRRLLGWRVSRMPSDPNTAEAEAMVKAIEAYESQTSREFSTDGLEAACWAFHEYMLAAKDAAA